MIDWIQQHAVTFGVITVMPLAMWAAKKYLPAFAKKYADIFLSAMVNPDITDPFIKEQVVIITKAAMRIAEHTMDGAVGSAKMEWVVSYVCTKTSLKKEDVAAIAQGIYDAIRGELKEHGQDVSVELPPEVKP